MIDDAPLKADAVLPVGKTLLKVEVSNLKKNMIESPSSIKLVYFVGEGERKVVPDTWLKLNQDETAEYKGKPYLDVTPTVLTKFWLVFPWGVGLAYLYGGKQEVHTCFNPDVLWGMLPCGFLFSIADVSEILAQGGIDPTTYIVLSQARLLLTAVVMKIRIGKGQTTLQWMDLMILTIMIIVFQMMPNDFNASKPKGATVKDNAMLGVVMTMAKVLLSVYAGVAQQKAMQGGGAAGGWHPRDPARAPLVLRRARHAARRLRVLGRPGRWLGSPHVGGGFRVQHQDLFGLALREALRRAGQ